MEADARIYRYRYTINYRRLSIYSTYAIIDSRDEIGASFNRDPRRRKIECRVECGAYYVTATESKEYRFNELRDVCSV